MVVVQWPYERPDRDTVANVIPTAQILSERENDSFGAVSAIQGGYDQPFKLVPTYGVYDLFFTEERRDAILQSVKNDDAVVLIVEIKSYQRGG